MYSVFINRGTQVSRATHWHTRLHMLTFYRSHICTCLLSLTSAHSTIRNPLSVWRLSCMHKNKINACNITSAAITTHCTLYISMTLSIVYWVRVDFLRAELYTTTNLNTTTVNVSSEYHIILVLHDCIMITTMWLCGLQLATYKQQRPHTCTWVMN